MSPEFQPTAKLTTLRQRARLLAAMRQFLDSQGYWEVETPLVSQDRVVDTHLDPFLVVSEDRLAIAVNRYLQTSPEFAMKRLLAAGADAIYQLGKVFRQGERGQRHNPEFTMLEWYKVGDDAAAQMDFTTNLVRHTARAAGVAICDIGRITYHEAFLRFTDLDVWQCSNAALAHLAERRNVCVPASLAADDRDGWLNLLLAELIEPHLGAEQPEFLFGYPPSQAALARVTPGEFPVAARFELYWRGVELCNGYHELTDPSELRRRIADESTRRQACGLAPLPDQSLLLTAMEAGLPESAGVALGVDRLVMLLLGETTIDAVIPFPWERA